MIDRAVKPLFEFQCARWPPQVTYASKLDALQKKMLSFMLVVGQLVNEKMKQGEFADRLE